MSNTILIKRSSTPNSVPTAGSLSQGELAINLVDGNLFYKNSSDAVTVIASNKFVTVTGNVAGANVNASSTVSAGGNVVGGNVTTAGQVSAAGNVTGNYILGNISQATGYSASKIYNGTTEVNIAAANANANISVGGTSNVAVFATTGAYVTGLVSASGNITGANINGNGSGLSAITGANVTGTVANATYAVSAGSATTATTAGTVTTAAQPNITSVGTLTSVAVTGNTTSGNLLTAGLISAAGTITGGNLSGTNIAGTLTTAAQTNITSVGTLGSLAVTGNTTSGNFIGILNGSGANVTSISATNISSGTLAQARLANSAVTLGSTALTLGATVTTVAGLSSVTSTTFVGALTGAATTAGTVTTAAQPNITSVGTLTSVTVTGNAVGGNINTAGQVSAGGNITGGNVNTNTVSGTGTTIKSNGALNLSATGNVVVNDVVINGLATPVQSADAATKGYVDSVAQGLDPKPSVSFATAAALPAYTYNNGSSGVGATITANAAGALTIDGGSPTAGDRVLIKNETSTNQPYNGIYVVTNAGSVGAAFVLTRATDFDSASPSGEIPGAFVFVEGGSTQADTGWVCTTNSPVTVGTTNITFVQFSGAGTYAAGTGLTLTGTTFSVNASQTQITSVGTLGSLAVTGTTTSGNLSTAGFASAGGNVTGGNILTAGLISAAGNITGGNILGGANVNATTHTGVTASLSGNVTGGNILTAGLMSAAGTITGGNITTTGTGTVATLVVSTLANITATTAATSTTTGALKVAGGIGIAGNVYAADIYKNGVTVINANDTVDGGTY